MIRSKKLLGAFMLAFLFLAISLYGQTNTANTINSPYSRYGYGKLSDQYFGNSMGMGGVSYGLRSGAQINASNPASYSAIDSLSFIFDVGITLQNTNFNEGGKKINAKNSTFDYIALMFPISKKLALSGGFLPYSTVGYNISSVKKVTGSDINYNQTYYGDGGINQGYVGLGYLISKNLSVGANFSYLFGDINRYDSLTFPADATIAKYVYKENLDVSTLKMDFGVQYSYHIDPHKVLTFGLAYSPQMSISNKAVTTLSKSGVTYNDTIKNGFDIPHTFGFGVSYVYDKRFTVGADYTLQKWGDASYFGQKGAFKDRSKVSLGAEYIPSLVGRNYIKRIKYRIGGYYSDSYIVQDQASSINGPKEYGVSAGLGLPISASKSQLNISFQYVHVAPQNSSMITENSLRLNFNLTFNERWFLRWKL